MFRDEKLYKHKEEYRLVQDQYWIDMRNQKVVEYNLALLKEESTFGLDEIAVDYIRFPESNDFGSFEEKIKIIENIIKKVSLSLKSSEIILGAFIFSYISWGLDVGIGQSLNEFEEHMDRLYPMLYPSHFAPGTLGYQVPGNYPYEIIDESCNKSKKLMINPKKSIPMLQAFWYSQKKLYLQLQAVHNNQMDGFILWNSAGNYNLFFKY